MSTLLVHGGGFGGSCWDRLVPHIDGPVVAVDLPGRGSRPAELATMRTSHYVDAIVEEIDRLGDNVLLVGHSMAGISMPRVMELVGDRLSGAVFVSCSIPPHGGTVIDAILGIDAIADIDLSLAALPAPGGVEPVLDPKFAREMFCNDMDEATTQYTLSLMVPEARSVITEPIDTSGLLLPIRKTWVRLTGDVIVPLDRQDAMIARIPDIEVIDFDAAHMAMITKPAELAAVINGLNATASVQGEA